MDIEVRDGDHMGLSWPGEVTLQEVVGMQKDETQQNEWRRWSVWPRPVRDSPQGEVKLQAVSSGSFINRNSKRTDYKNKQMINLTSCCYLKSHRQACLGENRVKYLCSMTFFFFFPPLRTHLQWVSVLTVSLCITVQYALQTISAPVIAVPCPLLVVMVTSHFFQVTKITTFEIKLSGTISEV